VSKVVAVVLNHREQTAGLLEAGAFLLRVDSGGRLHALAIRVPPVATILPSEEVLTARREITLREEQQRWAADLKVAVEEWSTHGIRPDWIDVEGDGAAIVAQHGQRADAIVIGRPAAHETVWVHQRLHAALFDTDRPVLVVPPIFTGRLGEVVAIAWQDDPSATKAVLAGMPILTRARSVHVLRAEGPATMPPVLTEHEIAAEFHSVPHGEGSTGERLLAAAHAVGADLLVMGAFAHAPWRELLFGGVTHTLLSAADLPLLMMH
jgi:nucleotide-binding universal stress UspA family protein